MMYFRPLALKMDHEMALRPASAANQRIHCFWTTWALDPPIQHKHKSITTSPRPESIAISTIHYGPVHTQRSAEDISARDTCFRHSTNHTSPFCLTQGHLPKLTSVAVRSRQICAVSAIRDIDGGTALNAASINRLACDISSSFTLSLRPCSLCRLCVSQWTSLLPLADGHFINPHVPNENRGDVVGH
jgi:hypothetical protein